MRRRNLANIYDLGVKELWSLWRDPMMLVLIVYVFTASVYTRATSMPETLHNAPIAIVDEDNSALSQRVASAFYPPQFTPPAMIDYGDVDPGMDAGLYTFALVIPPNFQRDVLAGRSPAAQLNVDATRMSQAFTGSGYIQQIVEMWLILVSLNYFRNTISCQLNAGHWHVLGAIKRGKKWEDDRYQSPEKRLQA